MLENYKEIWNKFKCLIWSKNNSDMKKLRI